MELRPAHIDPTAASNDRTRNGRAERVSHFLLLTRAIEIEGEAPLISIAETIDD